MVRRKPGGPVGGTGRGTVCSRSGGASWAWIGRDAFRAPQEPRGAAQVVEDVADALVPRLEAVHQQVLGRPPQRRPHVAFYPYASTKSTIRESDGQVRLRISDHLRDAPDAVLDGLMGLLLARMHRRPESRVDPEALRAYHDHLEGDKISQRRRDSRRSRGRKRLEPVGRHRSLLESYLRVALDMDLMLPEAPRLGWGPTPSRRRFGHHDPDHGCIVISPVLDDPAVPLEVLDYVVHHELLHIVHPPKPGRGNRRIVHHKVFREAERRFPRWQEWEAWIEALAAGRKAPTPAVV